MWEQSGLLALLKMLVGTGTFYNTKWVTFKTALDGAGNAHTYDAARKSDFPGYADITNAWAVAPFINGSNKGEAETGLMTWECSGGGASQNVVGLGLITTFSDSGSESTVLLWYDHAFAATVMVDAGDKFIRKVKAGDDTMVVAP